MPSHAMSKVDSVGETTPTDVPSGKCRLLNCAAEIFAQRGYAGTSVADIAMRADISKSTVFHHFPSKRALYLAVIETAVEDFAKALESLLETPGAVNEMLSNFQHQHMAHIMRNEQVTQLVLRELQKNAGKESEHLVRDVLSGNFQRLVEFISNAQQDDLIRADIDPSVAALMLISANVFFFQHQKVLNYLPNFMHANDPKGYANAVSHLIFHGLSKDPSK